jgi:hypothetical protein
MQVSTGSTVANLDAFYKWDNEGKMTSMVSPGAPGGDMPMQYGYSYDPMGRLNGSHRVPGNVRPAS